MASADDVSALKVAHGAGSWYDVVGTAVYAALDHDFALHFCGTTLPQTLTRASLGVAAREFSLPPARVAELADDVVQLVRTGLPDALQDVARAGRSTEMLDKLSASVLQTSTALGKRLIT